MHRVFQGFIDLLSVAGDASYRRKLVTAGIGKAAYRGGA